MAFSIPFLAYASARIWVTISSPEAGVFEQSTDDGKTWSTICDLPCEPTVIAAPDAKHRVVTHEAVVPLVVTGEAGEHVEVVVRPLSRVSMPWILLSAGSFSLGIGLAVGQWRAKENSLTDDQEGLLTTGSVVSGLCGIVSLIAAFTQPKAGFESVLTKRSD